MPRTVIRPDAIEAGRARLAPGDAHHLGRVLRLRPGSLVDAADGTGRVYTVRLESLRPGEAWGTIVDERVEPRESPCAITLGQGMLKGERMGWVIQKATELGVVRIVPIDTERVVARAPAERVESRQARWQRMAREAVKQCGRSVIPRVEPPRRLADVIGEVARHDATWLMWEGGGTALAEVARDLHGPRRVLLLVGPEGGFTPAEAGLAEAAGVRLVGLGPRTLRAETAGLAALVLCQHCFGDLGSAPQPPLLV